MSTLPHDVALMGDFNLRIDSSSSDAGQLTDILWSFDLHQYVDFPTHIHSHSLDHMICSSGCNVLSVLTSDLISDHFSVVADLQIPSNHSRTILKTIKDRKLQSTNIGAFKADIKNSDLIRYPKANATELAPQYNSVLYTLINLHSPLVSRMIFLKPPNPCMTPAILASKRSCFYCCFCKHIQIIFINKISVIHSSCPSDSQSRVLSPPDTRKVLQNLSCVTADEVRHFVLRALCKSSDLDLIPTSLVKDCIDILITPITTIINLSLTEGSFPSHFKSAQVSPF